MIDATTLINKSPFNLTQSTKQTDIASVFAEREGSYVNELHLFVAYFHCIPNSIEEANIDCNKAHNWFLEQYSEEVLEHFYNKRTSRQAHDSNYHDMFYILFNDLIVKFDMNRSKVYFLFRNTTQAQVDSLINGILAFKKKKQKQQPEVILLVNDITGIDTKPLGIQKPKLSIDDNYNDDFKEVHKTIIKRLSKKNDKGLVLLHGKPGTGKTSYIRYLIATLKKDVIFLPPNMAEAITNPNLISILINNPNSVFVIEDAENIVVDREKEAGSTVSALLNISDGLLADCLNIQLICSFNTDISKIDPALMRKGRLIAKYEFKELSQQKAQHLSNKLGFTNSIEQPMLLTAIYNQGEQSFNAEIKKRTIGFQTADE